MPATNAKLLVVDDEPDTRKLLGQILGGLGHSVRTAGDGFDALECIRDERPDILVSDLNMPGMSGFELLSVVRRRLPGIYVIATSGAFSGEEVPRGIAADAFHEKATGLAGLFAIVKTAVAHRGEKRLGDTAEMPIWISPGRLDTSTDAEVLLTCQQCLRAFPLTVGAADFVIHRTECVFCVTPIYYATVQPMDPGLPHLFQAHINTAEEDRKDAAY